MDRRDFLKFAAAAPLAAQLPSTDGMTVADIKRFVVQMKASLINDGWCAIIHPSQARDLRDLAARERWQTAYRAWRKDGKPTLTCQNILDKYTQIHTWDVDVTEGIGSYEGVRFITSESVL